MNKLVVRLEQLEKKLDQKTLLDHAYKYFVTITPIASGNAKSKTVKEGTDTIFANYAYAQRLNKGWSSQAKAGMSQPTIEELRKHIKG